MTVALYAFIATKTTYDVALPRIASTQVEFNRRVSGAFAGLAGGTITAGDIRLRPVATSIPNHLICDGSILNIVAFPELFACLGTTFGGDGVLTFQIPDYVNQALNTATTSPPQTIDGGTVTTGDPVTSDPTLPGGSDGGNIVSGGRPPKVDNPFDTR